MLTEFYALTRTGVTPPGGGPERVHIVIGDATSAACGRVAADGWGGNTGTTPITDLSTVTCPWCLGLVTVQMRAPIALVPTPPPPGPSTTDGPPIVPELPPEPPATVRFVSRNLLPRGRRR